jgi:hypothetical protein
MSRSLVIAAACALVAAGAAQPAAVQDPALDRLERRREALARGFDMAREHPRLAGYVRTLARALGGAAAFRQATVSTIPSSSSDRHLVLRAATELVARRFRLAPEGVSARFARVARPHAGRITLRGGFADVVVSDRHRGHDDMILAVVAHEFAHAALERGLAGTAEAGLAEDECLVDAAAVMVGFGPIMLRASFQAQVTGSGRSRQWEVVRIGELDPVAIAYLTLAQAELAGGDEETRRVFIARWMEPAWSFRRGQWERLRPRRTVAGEAVECPTCLSVAPALPGGTTFACPVCGLHASIDRRWP